MTQVELGMLFSRSGLQLLAVTRAAYRLASEIVSDRLPDPVMTPDGPSWCLMSVVRTSMRDAISQLEGSGPLLASFDDRLPAACTAVAATATVCRVKINGIPSLTFILFGI